MRIIAWALTALGLGARRVAALVFPTNGKARYGSYMNDDDPEIESSPLCTSVTRDGVTVRVQIYRLAGSGEGWSLEVVDEEGGSTVWDDLFANDQDAYDEFCRTLDTEGILSFFGRPH